MSLGPAGQPGLARNLPYLPPNRERQIRASPREDTTMKNQSMKMMVAAAALVAAAGVASAQSMKAEIPVRFQAAGAWLEPGTYSISNVNGSSAIYRIANLDSAGVVVAMPQFSMARYKADDNSGKLVFECVDGRCALVQLWDGHRGLGYAFK